jgi:hypothetical protein
MGPIAPKKKNKGEKSAAGRIRACDERYGMAHSRAGTVNKRKKGERDKETDRRERERSDPDAKRRCAVANITDKKKKKKKKKN